MASVYSGKVSGVTEGECELALAATTCVAKSEATFKISVLGTIKTPPFYAYYSTKE